MSKVSSKIALDDRTSEFSFGKFVLGDDLRCTGEVTPLTPKALAVLRLLVENAGRLVTKDTLWQTVWPHVIVTDAALSMCVAEVRRALGDDARHPRFIATVPKRGYRFVHPLDDSSPVAAPRQRAVAAQAVARGPDGDAQASAPLVGRDDEIAGLEESLAMAVGSRRQLVLVVGEPGIGKTSLLDAFKASLARRDDVRAISGQCSEHFGPAEAYLPLLDAMGRACRGPDGHYVVELLARHAPLWLAQMPGLIDDAQVETLRHRTVRATPERMLRELAEVLEVLATDRTLVLCLEDLHWSDCATLDWLSFIARRDVPCRLLVVATFRNAPAIRSGHPLRELAPTLAIRGLCRLIEVGPLDTCAVRCLLDLELGSATSASAACRDELAQALQARTGGNPLYLVNLLETYRAQGWLQGAGATLDAALAATQAPFLHEGLREAIALQLDQLAFDELSALGAASIIGERFSSAALAAALEIDEQRAEATCEELALETGLIREAGVGAWPDGTLATVYAFRHALYRESLYARIPRGRAVRLHRLVGQRLECAYAGQLAEIAAELAIHAGRGHQHAAAARHSLLAGRSALTRAAYAEAEAHLRYGLDQLDAAPAGVAAEERQTRLALHLALGQTLHARRGWASPEAERSFGEARQISTRGDDDQDARFTALWGLAAGAVVQADFSRYAALGQQLAGLARQTRRDLHAACAHWAIGQAAFHDGRYARAVNELEQAMAHYERISLPEQFDLLGMDFGVWSLAYLSHAHWCLGRFDRARVVSREACDLAQSIEHAFSQAMALDYAATLHFLLQEPAAATRAAAAAIALCETQGFQYYLGWARFMHGLLDRSEASSGADTAQMQHGLDLMRASGARLRRAYYLALLADEHTRNVTEAAARAACSAACEEFAQTGERCWLPELQRVEGELASVFAADPANAETRYRAAIGTAREQDALAWELRSSIPLARLLAVQKRRMEARRLLTTLLRNFADDDVNPLLEAAREQLARLR